MSSTGTRAHVELHVAVLEANVAACGTGHVHSVSVGADVRAYGSPSR